MTSLQHTDNCIYTSAGPVPMPCELRQVDYLAGLFKTKAEPLEQLLHNTGHRPALKFGKSYYVAIGFIQYTDTDLGPYNEIVISVPCIDKVQKPSWRSWVNLLSREEKRKVLQYVSHIYVTSRFSMVAGREIWGFPKELLLIDAKTDKSEFRYKISNMDGEYICGITGSLGLGFPIKNPDMITLTKKNSNSWITPLSAEGKSEFYFKPSMKIEVANCNHPLSGLLKKLELHNASPLLVFHSSSFKGSFGSGYPLV